MTVFLYEGHLWLWKQIWTKHHFLAPSVLTMYKDWSQGVLKKLHAFSPVETFFLKSLFLSPTESVVRRHLTSFDTHDYWNSSLWVFATVPQNALSVNFLTAEEFEFESCSSLEQQCNLDLDKRAIIQQNVQSLPRLSLIELFIQCSNDSSSYRQITRNWLPKHSFHADSSSQFHVLYFCEPKRTM